MNLRSNLIYSALFAASAIAAPAAWAQTQEPASPAQDFPPPETAQSPAQSSESRATQAEPDSATAPSSSSTANAAPISDQKIEQFANAYVAVQTIQQKAASELQTAKDPASADKVKANAETDMIAAVQKSGLQVDEFNHIVETMTADAGVRDRVAAKLQERQGGQ